MDAVEDFIELYPDLLPAAICAQIVARFESSPEKRPGEVGSGLNPELKRSDDLCISQVARWADVEDLLNTVMMQGLIRYLRRYPHLLLAPLSIHIHDRTTGQLRLLTAEELVASDDQRLIQFLRHAFRPGTINIQRYRADEGGYPYWHCEHYPKAGDVDPLHRVLLWTIYLNEGFGAGETEFLYQARRITPRTGALLLAPAAFTHTHRGNRPLGRDKYIATSWVLFRRSEELFGG
jgi:hypothetical protein